MNQYTFKNSERRHPSNRDGFGRDRKIEILDLTILLVSFAAIWFFGQTVFAGDKSNLRPLTKEEAAKYPVGVIGIETAEGFGPTGVATLVSPTGGAVGSGRFLVTVAHSLYKKNPDGGQVLAADIKSFRFAILSKKYPGYFDYYEFDRILAQPSYISSDTPKSKDEPAVVSLAASIADYAPMRISFPHFESQFKDSQAATLPSGRYSLVAYYNGMHVGGFPYPFLSELTLTPYNLYFPDASSEENTLYVHTAETESGTSGGPIVLRTTSDWIVFGVHNGRLPNSRRKSAVLFGSWVKSALSSL